MCMVSGKALITAIIRFITPNGLSKDMAAFARSILGSKMKTARLFSLVGLSLFVLAYAMSWMLATGQIPECASNAARKRLAVAISKSPAAKLVTRALLDIKNASEVEFHADERTRICEAQAVTHSGDMRIFYRLSPSSDKSDILVEVKRADTNPWPTSIQKVAQRALPGATHPPTREYELGFDDANPNGEFQPTADAIEYRFVEKGFDGGMTISKISECEVKWSLGCVTVQLYKIELQTVDLTNYHLCNVTALENAAGRVTDGSTVETSFASQMDEGAAPVTFDVVFNDHVAVVSGDPAILQNFCGLNGWFFGRYKRKPS